MYKESEEYGKDSLYARRAELWQSKQERREARQDARDEGFPRRRSGGFRMSAEDWTYRWNGNVYDTENEDEKKVELCNGESCITIIVSVASIALLSYLFGGKKMRKSKRNKASKRVSLKKM